MSQKAPYQEKYEKLKNALSKKLIKNLKKKRCLIKGP